MIELDRLINEKTQEIQQEILTMTQKAALRKIWDESEELETLLRKIKVVNKPLLLMAAGNIGFGKTTITRVTGKYGKIKTIHENPEKNFVLPWYYGDMAQYAERLQIHLINERLYKLAHVMSLHPEEALFSDRSIYEDTGIFCPVLCKGGLLSVEGNEFCNKYFTKKKEELETEFGHSFTPHLIVLVQGDAETGFKRVQERSREMEVRDNTGKGVGISREFYDGLNNIYEQFPEKLLSQFGYTGPILILSQNILEVVDATNSKGQLYIVKSIKETLKLAFSP